MRLQLFFDQTPMNKIRKIEMATNGDAEAMRVQYVGDKRWYAITTFTHTKRLRLTAERIDDAD
jgi:hypothetical protein